MTQIKHGETVTIVEMDTCSKIRKRLYEIGLNKGSKITMIKNDKGPVIICSKGNKLAIGRQLAQKIYVGTE